MIPSARRRNLDVRPLKPPTRCATYMPTANPATAPTSTPSTVVVDDDSSSSRKRRGDMAGEPCGGGYCPKVSYANAPREVRSRPACKKRAIHRRGFRGALWMVVSLSHKE